VYLTLSSVFAATSSPVSHMTEAADLMSRCFQAQSVAAHHHGGNNSRPSTSAFQSSGGALSGGDPRDDAVQGSTQMASNATALQEITRQLAELVYGGEEGVRAKEWAPADAETIRWVPGVRTENND